MKNQTLKRLAIIFSTLILCEAVTAFSLKYLSYSINPQLFFGLFGNNLLAIIFSFLFLIIFCFFFSSEKYYLSASVVIGATLANIFGRIFFAGAVDYFHLFFIPTFNLADVLIVGGIFMTFILVANSTNKKSLR